MSTKKLAPKPRAATGPLRAQGSAPRDAAFAEVVGMIEPARQRAYPAVNTELVGLYWQIGETFEHAVLDAPKLSAALREMHGNSAGSVFKDAYAVEFLGLLAGHSEAELHSGLLGRLRTFLIELGRDFCFVGSEHPLQVGGRDFALDLLLFHRGLNGLVATGLKVDRFEPEHLGKLNFNLEALDCDVKKARENPAIGVLLCASKDSEGVEYALSRSLSPVPVAQYQTQLPDEKLPAARLHEFYALTAPNPAPLAPLRKRKAMTEAQP